MKNLITGALIMSVLMISAQETKTTKVNDPVTIRVKKVEKINGVEKITDTTYTTKGPMTLEAIEKISLEHAGKKPDEKNKKVVIITDEVHGDNVRVVHHDEVMDEQMQRAMKTACEEGKKIEKFMIIDTDSRETKDGDNKMTKIVIIKTVKIVEPTEADMNLVNKETGMIDGKLAIDQMQFYPNPSTGKFNLDFNLSEKGNTAVTILNMEGKAVYNEELKDFTGHYKKEIDISANPKGVYFVRIQQGEHAQLKKIVLD